MSEDSVESSPEQNIVRIEYNNREYQIPIAESAEDITTLAEKRVKPHLAKALLLNGKDELDGRKRVKTGLAFVEYVYGTDEQTQHSEEGLQKLGFRPDEAVSLTNLWRRPGLHPHIHTLIDGMMEEDDEEIHYDRDELPFENRTFVIGPVTIDWDPIDATGGEGPTFEEDESSCKFDPDGAFAIDGQTLVEIANFKRGPNKITNKDIISMLGKIGLEQLIKSRP